MSKGRDWKAEAIYETLQRNYPMEIKQIHMLQAKDVRLFGKVQPDTDRIMNELMDRVVEDNKRRRGEIE